MIRNVAAWHRAAAVVLPCTGHVAQCGAVGGAKPQGGNQQPARGLGSSNSSSSWSRTRSSSSWQHRRLGGTARYWLAAIVPAGLEC